MKRIIMLLLACCLLVGAAAAAGGSGTAADPYIIETPAELQSIHNNLGAYYQLANDIDLSGVTWTPIGTSSAAFFGSFDGNGKTIKNLELSTTSQQTGLFGCVTSGAIIKDVTFEDCSVVSTSSQCGVVIGQISMSSSTHETAIISNVDCIRCSVSSDTASIGCLIGTIMTYSVVDIINCDVSYSIAESTGQYIVGCLVGRIDTYSTVQITGSNIMYSHARAISSTAGCLLGVCRGGSSLVVDSSTVENSIAECISGNYVSCFIGNNRGESSSSVLNCDIINCIAKGNDYVGGIFSHCADSNSVITAQSSTVTDCTIIATRNYAGGIVSSCHDGGIGTITDCDVTDSTVMALSYAAGICSVFS